MKVKNILGNEYQGSLGKSVTAATWKGRNYFKKWFKPSNPNTARQATVRSYFSLAVGIWQGFSSIEKGAYAWAERYAKLMISPYNMMIRRYMQITTAGGGYVAPPARTPKVVNAVGGAAVVGALVLIRKHGQTTDYYREFTDAAGNTQSSVIVGDQNYDIYITADLFDDFSDTDKTALEICEDWGIDLT